MFVCYFQPFEGTSRWPTYKSRRKVFADQEHKFSFTISLLRIALFKSSEKMVHSQTLDGIGRAANKDNDWEVFLKINCKLN
jgi:hypothetical protein